MIAEGIAWELGEVKPKQPGGKVKPGITFFW